MKVADNAAAAYKGYGFIDSAANTVDDYSYDANGNMTKDNNKNITAITYNHLNLPVKITFATTGNIVYIYNAAGQKVQKIVTTLSPANVTTTDYLGGYQYENAVLKFFPTAEGYVEPSGSSYKYVYQYKDHLGNIRLSYDKTLAIQEENNYYPFGLKHIGYNNVKTGVENKYKYNGKELQDELGLNMYDYHARNYDPALGRWINIDPLSELSRRWSPYSYCYSNPIRYVDPDGMLAKSVIDDLINKSDNDKATKWTFNSDGTATGSNGETANTSENQEENSDGPGDGPSFGHKPKESTSVVGKFFNRIGSKVGKHKTTLANKLADQHHRNETMIMAYSVVMEALIETTDVGDMLGKSRDILTETYGNQESQNVSEIYSNIIGLVKGIKEAVPGHKLTDGYILRVSAAFGAKAIGLQIQNETIALTIKGLDENVFHNRRIDPSQTRTSTGGFGGGGFSGGGSLGEW